jgi:gamma-glutamyl:cysteine ligase YbdK (ATP-grasp superfamily)
MLGKRQLGATQNRNKRYQSIKRNVAQLEKFNSMTDTEQELESEGEKEMREAFERQAEKILENQERYRKSSDGFRIGLETEYPAVDEDLEPLDPEVRNQVIDCLDFADVEVGGAQVEVRTDPMDPDSLEELENEMMEIERKLRQDAETQEAEIVRSGTHPFVDLDSIPTTDEPKYDEVPSFHDTHRGGHVQDTFGRRDSIDPRDADLAAVINSTQTNVEAPDVETAVDRANITYMISPFMSALSANARFVDGKDTGFADIRMPLWEKSHDIRTEGELTEEPVKAGKLQSYYDDLQDYFDRVKEQPFILHEEEEALDIGIGTFWKDSRIKFKQEPEKDRYDAIVESRVVSTQPTIPEEIAMHGFYVGRLAYSEMEQYHGEDGEELMDIGNVNRNRYAAMYNGLDTKLYGTDGELQDATEVLEEELEKAEIGLEYAGIEDPGYMDLLYDRLEEGTPSEQMAEDFYESLESGSSRDQALAESLRNQGVVR